MATELPFQDSFPFELDSPNPNFSSAFDSLPLPNDDDLSLDLTFPDGFMADLGFEDADLDFSIEDILCLPSSQSEDLPVGDFDGGSGISLLSHVSEDPGSDTAGNLNSKPPESPGRIFDGSACSNPSQVSNSASPDSTHRESSGSLSNDRSLGATKVLNSPSPVSDSQGGHFPGNLSGERRSDDGRDREFSGSVSDDQSSPDSGSVSSSLDSSNTKTDAGTDQKMKMEEGNNGCLLKRKKGKHDGNPDPRNSKFPRSITTEDGKSPNACCEGNDEEDKKKARLMRNRESAQLSRQRKKHYVEELEDKVRSMHSTIADLNNKITFVLAENASLRQKLSGGSVCPQPPPGIYPPPPMAPMHFPWVPCSTYPLKPQGSQVPLIPIPRLKPQQPVSVSKARKAENKKADGKKAESKTKKLPSVSFMGFLFFLLILGGLVPFVNLRYGGLRNRVSGGLDFVDDMHDGHTHGRVLTVAGHLNGSDRSDGFEFYEGKAGLGKHGHEMIDRESDLKQKEKGPRSGPEGFGLQGNVSEPLVASLYVPRNDKLVKIDGNLIIHSVLASERAVASSQAKSRMKSDNPIVSSGKEAGETGLAIAGNLPSALAISKPGREAEMHSHVYRSTTERPKALTSGSGDSYADTDGRLQQWFREGLAGPILSSGMCTEVFQFEISPASANRGAIIPAGPAVNASAKHPSPAASSQPSKMKNRRFLYHPPIPLNGTALNSSREHTATPPHGSTNFQGNKSSMVVSVLVDPREGRDGDGDVMMGSKSLSRIFVVVLLDSVKYVTYSCVLPLKGSGPHLVTT